jgi:hypothetical protein
MLRLITCSDTYTLGRTPLDKGSARCRDLYLSFLFFFCGAATQRGYGLLILEVETSTCTTHNIHTRQTSIPPRGNRNRTPSKLAARELRLRPRGKQDRHKVYCHCYIQESDYIYKTSAFFLQLWDLVVAAVATETVSNVSYSYRPGGDNRVCSSETSETLATIT